MKLKVKTSPQWHPISHSGNSHDFNALRELNGGSLATKHNLRFNGSRTLATTSNATSTSSSSKSVSTPSASITLEKKPTFQTQSRSDFLKNLSRKSASKDASRVLEKSKASTENEISCNTPESRDSTNEEQQYRANFILSSEEEEIAFLRSLGWEEDNKDNKDDECLTEKEIQDFYDKVRNCLFLSSYITLSECLYLVFYFGMIALIWLFCHAVWEIAIAMIWI